MVQHFGKNHKLKSKKKTDVLFKKGKRIHGPCLTLVFLKEKIEENQPKVPPQLLVSVPKRNFKKAVDRNLLRRRIKEAFRLYLQQNETMDFSSCHWYFALVYKDTRIRDFNDIQTSLRLLLRKLEDKNT